MSVENNVPEIRFNGFSGEWEEYPLSTFINSMDAGVSVNSGDRPANESEFGILKTSCVTNGFFEPNENKIVFKAEEINRLKEPVLENTIIISRMNTPALVGANAYIGKGFANYFLPDRLWAAKPTSVGDLKFIAYILGSDKGRLALSELATGTSGSMKNISKASVLRLKFRAPLDQEQTQIGNTFQKLDNLIKQHQQKHDKLNSIKKAMLEKMFPKLGETIPEIRFKGFSGEWEEKKLGDIGETFTGLAGKTKLDFGHGQARFVTYMNVFANAISNENLVEPIEVDDSQNEVIKGDVFFTTSSETPEEVGMSSVWMGEARNVYLNSFCFGYRPKKKIDSAYLAYMLRASIFRKQVVFLAQGVSRYNISKTKVMDIKIYLPSFLEQEKIGSYFLKLDDLINQHQQQITKLNNIKQACLSKMFV
ncbi:restriction endonuclease subunit S [Aeromonas enteropelogenes]|uniref:restriction endonuclease subunit S n=1 Tax=Aeromonas enteropelogenes TaxID=29489 RepID=UPI00398A1741